MGYQQMALLAALASSSAPAAHAAPECNTRSGYVEAQPASPQELASNGTADTVPMESAALEGQVIAIDLRKDINSLIGMAGRLTDGAAVLGVRFENAPQFDPTKHCNMVTLRIYKPNNERLAHGHYRRPH